MCVRETASSLISKYLGTGAKVSSKNRQEIKDSNTIFQINLMQIRQAFEGALSALKLEDHVLIFIDGIDIRPSDIDYDDYFDCVRGLIEAVWAVNNDFLGNIKDSKGRIRVVLLVRPDIFLRTGLHNINTKLRDNSVFLNWATSYKDYRGSLLFKVADRLLSAQQPSPPQRIGEMWDYYFPFDAQNVGVQTQIAGEVTSFLAFVRFSYYRPRDINSMIGTMQEIVRRKRSVAEYVTADDFNDPSFRDAHAEFVPNEVLLEELLIFFSAVIFGTDESDV